MTTPTYTADDVQKLHDAIVSGVKSIHFDGPPARTVVFQDMDELRRAYADAVTQVNGQATPATPRWRYTKTSKGI
jgi:hypothetical protein